MVQRRGGWDAGTGLRGWRGVLPLLRYGVRCRKRRKSGQLRGYKEGSGWRNGVVTNRPSGTAGPLRREQRLINGTMVKTQPTTKRKASQDDQITGLQTEP